MNNNNNNDYIIISLFGTQRAILNRSQNLLDIKTRTHTYQRASLIYCSNNAALNHSIGLNL